MTLRRAVRRTAPPALASLLLAAAAHSAAAAPAPAPLADHVPADAVVFFSWQGADNLQPAYAQSNLKGFLDASALPDFLTTTLPQLLEKQTGNANLGMQIQLAKNALLPLWKHPTAFYLGPLDFSKDPQNPTPRVALLCDAGSDAARINALLANIVQSAQQGDNAPKPSLASNDSMIVLALGFDANTLLAANPKSLAAAPAYLAALSHQSTFLPPTPALTAYVDIHGIIANLQDGFSKDTTVPPDVPQKFNAVIDALGIRNATQLSLAAGFDGKQWTQSMFLGIPKAPRTGLLRLLDPHPLPANALRAVPKDAVTAAVSTLDLDGLFNDIRAALPTIDPDTPRQFDEALNHYRTELGIDLHRDLIATLDGQITVYRAGADADAPYVAQIKLKDPQKFSATLATLTTKANAANFPYKIEQSTGDHGTTYTLKIPQLAIAWTVHKDTLYISTVHGLDEALDFADAQPPRPSLLENPSFATLRKAYPDNITAISYSDPAALYPEFYQAAQMVLLMGGAQLGVNLPSNLLPSPDAAAPFFSPTIQASWSDADGIHAAGRSAFPGAEVLGTQQASTGVAVAAMGTAILLPALGRSRELSNRTVDAANERAIAQSCVIYAIDHNDHFPDDLSQLVSAGQLAPKNLVSKRAGTPPLSDQQLQADKDHPDQLAKDLAAHTDFVYIGKGYDNDSDSSIIMLYEKPDPKITDGMNVAFDDGHVEFKRWSELADAFKATNELRRKHNLPPVNTEALVPM